MSTVAESSPHQDSKFQERDAAVEEFNTEELKYLRFILRRLRHLDQKVRESEDPASGSTVFNQLEMDGLTFILVQIGFLATPKEEAA